MVEHHELSVGCEAVVALVSQAATILVGVLSPVWDINRTVGNISRVVYPGLSAYFKISMSPSLPLSLYL